MTRISDALPGRSDQEYGTAYEEHVMEQYKLYVDKADQISARREGANSFFVTLNTALIAVATYLGTVTGPDLAPFVQVPVGVAGILLCYSWYRMIRSYRDLNTAKFKVVHEIEQRLPLRPYHAEWEEVGRGKDERLYLPFTHVEKNIPWVFLVLHAAVAVAGILLY
jgi:hypothetical protein